MYILTNILSVLATPVLEERNICAVITEIAVLTTAVNMPLTPTRYFGVGWEKEMRLCIWVMTATRKAIPETKDTNAIIVFINAVEIDTLNEPDEACFNHTNCLEVPGWLGK